MGAYSKVLFNQWFLQGAVAPLPDALLTGWERGVSVTGIFLKFVSVLPEYTPHHSLQTGRPDPNTLSREYSMCYICLPPHTMAVERRVEWCGMLGDLQCPPVACHIHCTHIRSSEALQNSTPFKQVLIGSTLKGVWTAHPLNCFKGFWKG